MVAKQATYLFTRLSLDKKKFRLFTTFFTIFCSIFPKSFILYYDKIPLTKGVFYGTKS